jgi:hypothetical protein
MAKEAIEIEAAGREVRPSSPSKLYFPEPGHTKRDLADRDEAERLGDTLWPPHLRKQRDEPKRVQPSRARKR